jgi:pimeloyl-ACP methyl ester carboxylesterase
VRDVKQYHGVQLTADNVTLHYEDDGDPDAPPVLFLHGLGQSAATWEWVVAHLAADHRVVRLDFRGHGSARSCSANPRCSWAIRSAAASPPGWPRPDPTSCAPSSSKIHHCSHRNAVRPAAG